MERARRRQLAEQLASKVQRSRKDLMAVVLFGSVARGDDGPDSDVEIAAVARRGSREAYRFVLEGVLFNVYWYNAPGLRAQMLEPDGDSVRHGFFEGVALYDPFHWFAKLKREVANLPPSFYRESARDALHQMYEYVCKARNARVRGDDANLVYATGSVGFLARSVVALLNHRHYRSENTMTDEWRQFRDLPQDFSRQIAPLIGDSAAVSVRYESAMALWKSCEDWAARRGVRLRRLKALPNVRRPSRREPGIRH